MELAMRPSRFSRWVAGAPGLRILRDRSPVRSVPHRRTSLGRASAWVGRLLGLKGAGKVGAEASGSRSVTGRLCHGSGPTVEVAAHASCG